MFTGTIKFWHASKGFGFISNVQGGNGSEPDCFLHVSELRRATGLETIEAGTKVAFDLGSHKGRVNAINLRILSETDQS